MFKQKWLVYISILLVMQIGVSGFGLENSMIGEPQSISVDPTILSAEHLVRSEDKTKAPTIPTPDEIKILNLVNAARQNPSSVGWGSYPAVGPLEPNINLWKAAQFHSQEMVDNGYFSHDSYDPAQGGYYEDAFERMIRFGYSGWSIMAENIAGNPTVEGAFASWLASTTGHRDRIFDGRLTETGIGVAVGGSTGKKHTQCFGDRYGISFDLKVLASNISFTPENPDPGDMVKITAVIHNEKKTHAFPVWVHFFNGDPNSGGELIGQDSIEAIINEYGQETSTINWNTSGQAPGGHEIWVKVDPNNYFSETNENNNSAYRSMYIGVEESQKPVPSFSLNIAGIYPFDKEVELTYYLNSPANCLLRIYDTCGKLVTTLVNEKKGPGCYKIHWDRANSCKDKVSSGIYFCNLRCNNIAITKKIAIIY